MDAIQFNPTLYPPNIMPYVEKTIPGWDLISKVLSAAISPLKILGWTYEALTNPEQYKKLDPPEADGHGLLGSFPEFRERNFQLLKFLADYNEKFGKEDGICKVNLGTRVFYIVTNPVYVKNILKHPKSFVRGDSLRVWREKFSPGGLSEGKDTQTHRQQTQNAIGQSELPFYFPGMRAVSTAWIERLATYSENGESFNLMDEAERAALATVGETLFKNHNAESSKNPFGLSIENDGHCTRFLSSYHTIFELLANRLTSITANIPYIGDKIYSAIFKDEDEKLAEVKDLLKEILVPIFKEIVESKIDKTSHLYKVMTILGVDIENPTYEDILDKSLGFLQASFETSSKALGWTLYHLSRDLKLQDKLREELFTAFKGKTPQTVEELKSVPLLSQVMEETLRLFPPFPVLVRDIENPDDFEKYKVEKGGTFLISPYLVHRNSKVWENPTQFDPERFKKSENRLDDLWQVEHSEYLPFLGGIHRCPGRHFGKLELLILIALFIMHYEITPENPLIFEPVDLKFSVTLKPTTPIKVKITRIESDNF